MLVGGYPGPSTATMSPGARTTRAIRSTTLPSPRWRAVRYRTLVVVFANDLPRMPTAYHPAMFDRARRRRVRAPTRPGSLDLKPANIVLRDGRPYLIDFGSARPIGQEQPPGRPIGTPGYVAPELERGARLAPPMDLFAAGTVLFEALTGAAAYDDAQRGGSSARGRSMPRLGHAGQCGPAWAIG